MRDILLAILGLAGFAIFCGVLIGFVPHIDLVIVVLLVLAMTAFDFFRELFRNRKKDEG